MKLGIGGDSPNGIGFISLEELAKSKPPAEPEA